MLHSDCCSIGLPGAIAYLEVSIPIVCVSSPSLLWCSCTAALGVSSGLIGTRLCTLSWAILTTVLSLPGLAGTRGGTLNNAEDATPGPFVGRAGIKGGYCLQKPDVIQLTPCSLSCWPSTVWSIMSCASECSCNGDRVNCRQFDSLSMCSSLPRLAASAGLAGPYV